MKLETVPIEITEELIELGFDWDIKYTYPEIRYSDTKYTGDLPLDNPKTARVEKSKPIIELDLVCKWFRETYGLFITIHRRIVNENLYFSLKYEYDVLLSDKLFSNKNENYITYEEAQTAAIKRTVKYLKDELHKNSL